MLGLFPQPKKKKKKKKSIFVYIFLWEMLMGVMTHEAPFKNALYGNKIGMNSLENVENLAKVMIEVEKLILLTLDKNAFNQ